MYIVPLVKRAGTLAKKTRLNMPKFGEPCGQRIAAVPLPFSKSVLARLNLAIEKHSLNSQSASARYLAALRQRTLAQGPSGACGAALSPDAPAGRREQFPTVVMDVLEHPYLVQVPFTTKGRNAMANQEHLDKLREGIDTWNQWRQDHPDITPDLSGATLTSANLQRADLTSANLRDASLMRANLQEASLAGANLRDANLTGANLAGTSFDDAITDGCLGCP